MAKKRVHELASALGVSSATVIQSLRDMGEFVRGPSSAVEPPVVRRLYRRLGHEAPEPAAARTTATPAPPEPSRTDAQERVNADPHAPSTRQYGWQANPVPPAKHPTLLRAAAEAEIAFPIFRDQRAALQALGSQVTSIPKTKEQALENAVIALVRFSGAIESAFGLTREVLFIYTPHRDLQQRTFDAAFAQLKLLPRDTVGDLVFLWAPDPRLRIKLGEWSKPGRLAVPLEFDVDQVSGLISLLRDHLYLRDLFFETTPVSGMKYFGRRTLLRSLRDDVLAQRVTGLFGLRKAGKTSTLMQLGEDLQTDNVISVLVDLESFPSPPDDPVDDILFAIKTKLVAELKARGRKGSQLNTLSHGDSIQQYKTALQALLRKQHTDGLRVLLLLDEIEYLTPADQIDIHEGPMPRISQLLAALRSIVQESTNFTFILSGLTSAIIESGRLYGRPNPLFSWAKPTYIGPLDQPEADDLATTVSARMGVAIDPGALKALHEATGGHPYLYRHLASNIVSSIDPTSMDRRISRAMVLSQLENWSRAVSGHVDEMVRHVERYYPLEAILLQLIRDRDPDLAQFVREEPEAVQHLLSLGLVRQIGAQYEGSVLLELR